jgi:hypothetical protein
MTGGRALDALVRTGDHHRCADLAIYLHLSEALCRTRTDDPFLTIVSRDRNGRTLAVTVDVNVPANRQVVGVGQ